MKLFTLLFSITLFSVPCFAQTPSKETQEAQAQTLQMISANAELKSENARLENLLAIAQKRIAELESAAQTTNRRSPAPQQIVVHVDNSAADQANRELAANLSVQRALAIAGAFKTQPVPVQMPQPAINCTSVRVLNEIQTVCR